jgi:hypothetical protein
MHVLQPHGTARASHDWLRQTHQRYETFLGRRFNASFPMAHYGNRQGANDILFQKIQSI